MEKLPGKIPAHESRRDIAAKKIAQVIVGIQVLLSKKVMTWQQRTTPTTRKVIFILLGIIWALSLIYLTYSSLSEPPPHRKLLVPENMPERIRNSGHL